MVKKTQKKKVSEKILTYDFKGYGWILTGTNDFSSPELLKIINFRVEQIIPLSNKKTSKLISEAKKYLKKKNVLYIDTYGLIDSDYVHNTGYLFNPIELQIFNSDNPDPDVILEYVKNFSDLY